MRCGIPSATASRPGMVSLPRGRCWGLAPAKRPAGGLRWEGGGHPPFAGVGAGSSCPPAWSAPHTHCGSPRPKTTLEAVAAGWDPRGGEIRDPRARGPAGQACVCVCEIWSVQYHVV